MTSVRKELKQVMDWQDNFDNHIQKMLNEFRELYTELAGKQTRDLTFGQALGAMKRGRTVKRAGDTETYTISRLEEDKLTAHHEPGLFNAYDILADDWMVV